MSASGTPKRGSKDLSSERSPIIINEIPVWRLGQTIDETIHSFDEDFLLQLRKLNTAQSPDLADDSADKYAVFGKWKYIWGSKATPASAEDKGLLNIGQIIGKEFVINETIKTKRGITSNISYRIDWDDVKGKHINSIELFNASLTKESSPKYRSNVKKAYLYSKIVAYLYDSTIPKPAGDDERLLKEFINESKAEPKESILKFTKKALRDGAEMDTQLARTILQLFVRDKNYLKSYFKEFHSALRPLIDCARYVYLKNEGDHPLAKDEYNYKDVTVGNKNNLHKIVSEYNSYWKRETTEVLKVFAALHKLQAKQEANTITDSEKSKLEELIDENENNMSKFLVSEAHDILINEIYHGLCEHTESLLILTDLLETFDRIKDKTILEKFFETIYESLLEDKDREVFSEFTKLTLDPDYRIQYLAAHEKAAETSMQLKLRSELNSKDEISEPLNDVDIEDDEVKKTGPRM